MSDLHIRDARADERAVAEAVTMAAYEQYQVDLGEHWGGYRNNIVATLAAKGAEQIVALQNGVVAGTVLLFPAGSVAGLPTGGEAELEYPEIRLLAVPPAMRGHGIGGALTRECLRRAHLARAPIITLHTTDMMRVAMAMYERMGFVRAPELDFRPVPSVTVKGFRYTFEDE